MKAKHARIAIDAILRSIDEDELPRPDKVEETGGTTIVWFGGLGHHIGSAKRNGARDADIYRNDGIRDALEGEALARIDAKNIAEVTR